MTEPVTLKANNAYPEQKQYSLALHTSSPQLGVGLGHFNGECRCQTWELGRDLVTHLHPLLAEFILPQSWQDLAFIAVAKGPGSFTGTRIGLVTARTLAQQLDIPVFAISTTAAVALEAKLHNSAIPESADLAVQMPAQRGQFFTAIYKAAPRGEGIVTLLPDKAQTLTEWQDTLNHWPNPYYVVFAEGNTGFSVSSLLAIAAWEWHQGQRPSWEDALPFYGQHPVE